MNVKGGPAVAYTEQRVASIARAIPLTTDKCVIEANVFMATALASQIKRVGELIRIYDERIESLFDTFPDAQLFKSLPGMGPCMGPRMLSAHRVKLVRCRQQQPPVRHAVVALVRLAAIVSEQLEFISSAFKVIETQRPKLACCGCDHIVQTSMPSKLAERSYAGPGLLAHIVTVKFAEHTPLTTGSRKYTADRVWS